MAKCFIHGMHLKEIPDGLGSKQACLKIYRDQDKAELSISFDNSLGAFKDECRRIEACMFDGSEYNRPIVTVYISDSSELSMVIQQFLAGHLKPQSGDHNALL